MIDFREAVYSLYAVWRLALLDPSHLHLINATTQGFWRSFFAAFLCLPAHFALLLLNADATLWERLGFTFFVLDIVTYALAWLLWPLIMYYVAELMDRGDRFLLYATAFNWAQVVGTYVMFAVALLTMGLLPQLWTVLSLLIVVVLLIYEGYIASKALEIGALQATGIAVMNFILMQFLFALAFPLPPESAGGVPDPGQ